MTAPASTAGFHLIKAGSASSGPHLPRPLRYSPGGWGPGGQDAQDPWRRLSSAWSPAVAQLNGASTRRLAVLLALDSEPACKPQPPSGGVENSPVVRPPESGAKPQSCVWETSLPRCAHQAPAPGGEAGAAPCAPGFCALGLHGSLALPLIRPCIVLTLLCL